MANSPFRQGKKSMLISSEAVGRAGAEDAKYLLASVSNHCNYRPSCRIEAFLV